MPISRYNELFICTVVPKACSHCYDISQKSKGKSQNRSYLLTCAPGEFTSLTSHSFLKNPHNIDIKSQQKMISGISGKEFPAGKSLFETPDIEFPMGKSLFETSNLKFPVGKSLLGIQNIEFPVGKSLPGTSNMKFPMKDFVRHAKTRYHSLMDRSKCRMPICCTNNILKKISRREIISIEKYPMYHIVRRTLIIERDYMIHLIERKKSEYNFFY